MKKKVMVISLGGSLIVPDEIDVKFLLSFKKVINRNLRKYKFIVVCGGGSTARKYISALKKTGADEKLQSLSGISATRMNARFMSYFFGINPFHGVPHTLKTLEKLIKNQNLVFCGALEYKPKQTSDSTAAEIAAHFKAEFINLTNVDGLHDKNPLKFKNAKFIPKIGWKEFDDMANRIKFHPGQHFVLDQTASKIILRNKIPTYILGKNMRELDNLLNSRKFKGTEIKG